MTLSQILRRLVSRTDAHLPFRSSGATASHGSPSDLDDRSWSAHAVSPWAPVEGDGVHACNICRWTGAEFLGGFHSEFAQCPRCGSISRDRFLFWCFVQRSPESLRARVLETSPRMGDDYRRAMARWFTYLASDYDESAHRASVRIDLQRIDRPAASFDVVLTPHVLEHVPTTADALSELHRVIAPGGRMYLQVPVLQGTTAPPTTPEFHGDNTPVFWRFGFDLTEQLRAHGFTTRLLCTEEWLDVVRAGSTAWPTETSGEVDVVSMLAGVRPDDLTVVADAAAALRFGFLPAYMFLTWECIRV